MKKLIVVVFLILFLSPVASAKMYASAKPWIPQEGLMGARILSVSYKYKERVNETEIKVYVKKNSVIYTLYFDKEHLPMGAVLVNKIGKKVNIGKSQGRFSLTFDTNK
jgi:hypothetical protein